MKVDVKDLDFCDWLIYLLFSIKGRKLFMEGFVFVTESFGWRYGLEKYEVQYMKI